MSAPGIGHSASKEEWRAGIQALRGLSVLAVILNHLGLPWIPGGYLGVDIFFVISGFVITTSFLRNTQPSSRLESFSDFWLRRFFRLWPSLFAVVLVTAAFLVLTSAARPGSILTGLASLFGLANFRLLLGRLEYFALDTNADWFMHLWSLSVEEQIYLMLSLVFVAVLGTRDRAGQVRVRLLGVVLGTATTASLGFALAPGTSEVARFYSPHTRFYQVGLGALVAVWFSSRSDASLRPESGLLRRLVAVAGASSLAGIAALLVVDVEPFRIGSLLTTLSAAVLIVTLILGATRSGLRRVPILVRIGDRSYSLYLVHWPIHLAAEMLVESTALRNASSLVATLAVGSISWRKVEEAFRFRYTTLTRARAGVVAVSSIVVVAAVTAGAFVLAERRTRPVGFDEPVATCDAADGRWWLVGDSHLKTHEGEISRVTGGDCTIVGGRGTVISYLVLDESQDGRQTHRAYLVSPDALIARIRGAARPPEALLIVHWLTGYLAEPQTAPESASAVTVEWFSSDGSSIGRNQFLVEFADTMARIADALDQRDGSLVIVSPPPDFNWLRAYVDPVYCSGRLFVSRECAMTRTEARITIAEHEARSGEYRNMLDELASSRANIVHVSLDDPFCNDEFCSNFHRGSLVYGDDDHLNPAGARLVGHYFDELERALVASK